MSDERISLKELREVVHHDPFPEQQNLKMCAVEVLALVEAVEAVHQWEIAVGDQDLALAEDRFRAALARFKDYGTDER